jgi:hypothetical protein
MPSRAQILIFTKVAVSGAPFCADERRTPEVSRSSIATFPMHTTNLPLP